MKRSIIILVILLAPAIYTGCNEIDQWTTFDIPISEEFTIDSMIGINLPFNFSTPSITTNSEASFANNDTRKDMVEEIYLTYAHLNLMSPSSGSFDFLESIYVYVNAGNLEEKLLAWNDSVPEDIGKYLELTPSTDDFQEFIKEDAIHFRIETTTDEFIMSDHTIKLDANFEVNAKILGI